MKYGIGFRSIALIASAVACGASAFAGSENNAGKGVIIDGKVVPIEETIIGMDIVTDKKAFLEKADDFMPLIREIAEVDSFFAAAIWDQLARRETHIYLTDAKLKITDDESTSLVEGRKADVQYGVRSGNNIVYNRQDFANTKQAYALVHEALHGLISYNRMHQTRVESMNRFLINNRGNYAKAGLKAAVEQNEVYTFGLRLFSENFETLEAPAMRILMLEQDSLQARCALLTLLPSDTFERLRTFGEYGKCDRKARSLDYLKSRYADLREFINNGYGFVSKIGATGHPGWGWRRDFHAKECEQMGTPEVAKNARARLAMFESARDKVRAFEDLDPSTSKTPAATLYDREAVKNEYYFNDFDQKIRNAREDVLEADENVAWCSKYIFKR